MLSDRVPLTIDLAELSSMPSLASHPFDPSNGFDMIEIAMLAAANNADLNAQRQQQNVSRAQLYSIGLLPDPQLSTSFDKSFMPEPAMACASLRAMRSNFLSEILSCASKKVLNVLDSIS